MAHTFVSDERDRGGGREGLGDGLNCAKLLGSMTNNADNTRAKAFSFVDAEPVFLRSDQAEQEHVVRKFLRTTKNQSCDTGVYFLRTNAKKTVCSLRKLTCRPTDCIIRVPTRLINYLTRASVMYLLMINWDSAHDAVVYILII